MIDFLQKLPDSLIGIAAACGLWFGFHYMVLADRAMDRQVRGQIVPACERDLGRSQALSDAMLEPLGNLPPLPFITEPFAALRRQFQVPAAERRAICECSARRSKDMIRFDYAIHTASLRLIAPASIGELRTKAAQVLRSQACGSLPWTGG